MRRDKGCYVFGAPNIVFETCYGLVRLGPCVNNDAIACTPVSGTDWQDVNKPYSVLIGVIAKLDIYTEF